MTGRADRDLVLHAPRAVLPDSDPATCSPDSGAAISATGEQAVTVTVAGGVITAVGPLDRTVGDGTERPQVVELGDDVVLLPGLVDTHVHVNEPGRTEWEGFATATRAAAAGGVTTIVDMPLNSMPPTLDPDALAVKRAAAAGQCVVDVGFWGGAVPGNLGRLRQLLDAGVMGVKCFLPDSGVAGVPGAVGGRPARAPPRRWPRPTGCCWCTPRTPTCWPRRRRPSGTDYAQFLASRPRGRGEPRDRAPSSTRPAAPARGCTSCTCPAPAPCPRSRPPRPTACG